MCLFNKLHVSLRVGLECTGGEVGIPLIWYCLSFCSPFFPGDDETALCPAESWELGILGLVGGRTQLLIVGGHLAMLLRSPCLSSLVHHAVGDSILSQPYCWDSRDLTPSSHCSAGSLAL